MEMYSNFIDPEMYKTNSNDEIIELYFKAMDNYIKFLCSYISLLEAKNNSQKNSI